MKRLAAELWQIFPDRYRVPLDILRRRSHWKSAEAIFFHVPKAAGVSVSRALYGRPLGHYYAVDVRRICPTLFKDLLTFGVVRHPMDRLFSAYRFAITGGTAEMGMENPYFYRNSLFSSFDKFVNGWLVHQPIETLDGVFKPQYLYLCDGSDVIVDKVIKMENLAQGMREVSSVLGKELIIGRSNKTQEMTLVIESKETVTAIQEFYKVDFDIFSYPLDPNSWL